jgi:phage baseplate assembly protein gpV
VIEDMLDAQADAQDAASAKIQGVVVGTVKLVTDPLMLGRVGVTLPFLDSSDTVAWARVATPMAGMLSGQYMIPNVGDEVLVAFEQGDVNAPYVIGCLWSAMRPPPFPSPLPQIRVLRTPLGNQVAFREAPPAITVTTPDMTQAAAGLPPGITLASNTMITLQCGPTRLVLSPSGVTIIAPAVSVTSTGAVTATGTNVSVTANAALTLASNGVCSIAGSLVKIN